MDDTNTVWQSYVLLLSKTPVKPQNSMCKFV